MNGAQILLGSAVVFIIYKSIISYRKSKLNIRFMLIWLLIWLVPLFIIFDQTIATRLANFIGITRGVDLVIYLSIILLYYLLYNIFLKICDLDKKITEIIRKDSLKKVIKPKK